MLAFLPLISLSLTFLIFSNSGLHRSSVLSASVTWGFFLAIATEVLSRFKLISFNSLLLLWVIVLAGLIYIYMKQIKQQEWNIKSNGASRNCKADVITPFLVLLLCGAAMIITAVGAIALISPPNNWDAMDYHMSRVAHWIQNHSVAHYPTAYTPQLYQDPWAEFAILHFQILSGGDRFANFVQWFSMLGSILGVSLIAKQLGADLRGQVFTAVVAATIPMGILQASNTQNDYVLAFWMVCLAYYVLQTAQRGKERNWTDSFNVGTSLGLAILTKGTAYFYVTPFLIWFVWSQTKRSSWRAWKPILIVAILTTALNIGHYLRNYNLFGSPLGSPEDYRNGMFGISVLISNLTRNIALHLGTPFALLSGITYKIVKIIHAVISMDINDHRTTFSKTFFVPGGLSTIGLTGNENSAGNLLHVLLLGLCITIFVVRLRRQCYVSVYLTAVLCAFFLFCYLVKWQAWNSRLHLPLFVMASTFIGVVLSRISKKFANSLVLILLLSSIPWVLCNRYRPMIGSNNIFEVSRIEQYFSDRIYLEKPYVEAANFLKSRGCSQIGLSLGDDPWEYPLWVVLKAHNKQQVYVEHVNVENISSSAQGSYFNKEFLPCAVVRSTTKKSGQKEIQQLVFKAKVYEQEEGSNDVEVLVKQ